MSLFASDCDQIKLQEDHLSEYSAQEHPFDPSKTTYKSFNKTFKGCEPFHYF